MKRIWRRALLLGAVASLTVTANAGAQVAIGALPDQTPEAVCGEGPFDITQQSVAPGVTYEVPFSGVLTSWSTRAADVPGQRFTFKLVTSVESQYLVRAQDGPRDLVPGQINTFRTLIPVQQGEILSISSTGAESGCEFFSDEAGDVTVGRNDVDTPVGQSWGPQFDDEGFLVNVAATILPPPRIAGISVTQGSVAGGTPVIVTGQNFAEVRSVTFSGVPALSYSVTNEGQLTAVAPPNKELTSRTIEVTTVAGRDSAPQSFNYIGCAVPNLRKATLKEAKSELRSAGCALGKVKRLKKASLKKGKVTRQSPAAYSILPPGTKVSVALKGGAPKKRHR